MKRAILVSLLSVISLSSQAYNYKIPYYDYKDKVFEDKQFEKIFENYISNLEKRHSTFEEKFNKAETKLFNDYDKAFKYAAYKRENERRKDLDKLFDNKTEKEFNKLVTDFIKSEREVFNYFFKNFKNYKKYSPENYAFLEKHVLELEKRFGKSLSDYASYQKSYNEMCFFKNHMSTKDFNTYSNYHIDADYCKYVYTKSKEDIGSYFRSIDRDIRKIERTLYMREQQIKREAEREKYLRLKYQYLFDK